MSSSKCSFTCTCGIFLPLNPSMTTVYARSAFYPSLRFTLSLQSAFYTQSAFYPWCAVCSLQSAFYSDRRDKLYLLKLPNRNSSPSSCISGTAFLIICEISLFVTATNREAILFVTNASLGSLARKNWR